MKRTIKISLEEYNELVKKAENFEKLRSKHFVHIEEIGIITKNKAVKLIAERIKQKNIGFINMNAENRRKILNFEIKLVGANSKINSLIDAMPKRRKKAFECLRPE